MKEDELFEAFVKASELEKIAWNEFTRAHTAYFHAGKAKERAWSAYQAHLERPADEVDDVHS